MPPLDLMGVLLTNDEPRDNSDYEKGYANASLLLINAGLKSKKIRLPCLSSLL